jgi:hypothetical protein
MRAFIDADYMGSIVLINNYQTLLVYPHSVLSYIYIHYQKQYLCRVSEALGKA